MNIGSVDESDSVRLLPGIGFIQAQKNAMMMQRSPFKDSHIQIRLTLFFLPNDPSYLGHVVEVLYTRNDQKQNGDTWFHPTLLTWQFHESKRGIGTLWQREMSNQ
jgi:hypothetical protein